MTVIERSLQIALRAYAGKTDKAGRESILHPLRVMAKMNTDLERSAALLAARDVLEDSDITPEELLAEGIPAGVVARGRVLLSSILNKTLPGSTIGGSIS